MTTGSMVLSQADIENRTFIVKVYGWMTFALLVTALVAIYTIDSPALLSVLLSSSYIFIGLLLVELILVGVLAAAVHKMSLPMAATTFVGYAALNGLTFAVIFLAFTAESIASTFLITAGTFGVMSAYGFFTKTDLTSIGNLLFMGLIGLIIASVVNIFLGSELIYWITTYVGILIFVGLIAYDTQKIKNMNIIGNEGTDEDRKEAIVGALVLYLDFINLFLLLLRLFGRRK